MAEITAQAVNELRKRTGLGLMECKALLQQAEGDLKKAETLAQEQGKTRAAGRAGRAAKAGRIEVALSDDSTSGAMVELNCETDFVARNDEFRQAAKDLAEHVLAQGDENLLDQKFAKDPSKSIRDAITAVNARTGENVVVARTARFSLNGPGRVDFYVHHDAKSGAMIELACSEAAQAQTEEFRQLAKDLALQVVAAKPLAVNREQMPQDAVAEQKRIFAAQVESQQAEKPQNIREKIADGMLNKWYAENVLLDQEFVKEPSKKVRDVIAAVGKGIEVNHIARFVVGESTEEPEAEA